MATIYDPRMIAVGVLGKPHGVRGEIGLRLFNNEGAAGEDAPVGLGPIILSARDGRTVTHVITAARPFGAGLLVTFAGINSREAAAALTNHEVLVERASLPAPAPGEYFVSDVIGCEVIDQDGTRLGVVRETFWNGAHDVMIVRVGGGASAEPEAERLIPLVPEFVREVDAPGRTIRVEWHDL
jgi:16S rRNA processing protein RimM